ncbi:MAG: hypothetical protein K5768_00270 [Firmicutes bacterium]|nr:hypothetical protein [Bacillota bacterium]
MFALKLTDGKVIGIGALKRNRGKFGRFLRGNKKTSPESNLKIASFPKKSENDELFSSRKKHWCRTAATTALKHRPAEPFGAGAIRTPLVLFWCYSAHKCDKKAIKVVFLVVSEIFESLMKLQIFD